MLDAHGVRHDAEDVLIRYARHEAAAEAGPYRTYAEVLASGSARVSAHELGFEPTADEVADVLAVGRGWPAFPDSAAALRATQASRSGSAS